MLWQYTVCLPDINEKDFIERVNKQLWPSDQVFQTLLDSMSDVFNDAKNNRLLYIHKNIHFNFNGNNPS